MLTQRYMVLSVAFLLIAATGCTTFQRPAGRPIKPEQAPPVKGLESPKVQPPKKVYDLRKLLVPVIQYYILVSSARSFGDFVENGKSDFTDDMYRAFTLESDAFMEGQGIVLTSYREKGPVHATLDRALLKNHADGSRWWQLQMNVGETWVFCELLISDLSAPLEVRYINPNTGKKYKTIPLFAVELEESLKEFSKEELTRMMAENRRILIEQEYQKLFQNPIAIGEERITTGGGGFDTIHIRDRGKEPGVMFDYWVSDRVPGGIVKIRRTNPDGTADTVELTGITHDNISQIQSSEAAEPERTDPFTPSVSS